MLKTAPQRPSRTPIMIPARLSTKICPIAQEKFEFPAPPFYTAANWNVMVFRTPKMTRHVILSKVQAAIRVPAIPFERP